MTAALPDSGVNDNVNGTELDEEQYQEDQEITFTVGTLKDFTKLLTREMLLQVMRQTQQNNATTDAGLNAPLEATNIVNGPPQNQPTTED